MDKHRNIGHVAIYLRKSRDEGEYDDVLSKHRDALIAIANSQNWNYKLYEEIGSGERIALRKKMPLLLEHVEEGRFDGVLVMDIDRLGRGNHSDWARICECFLSSDTFVITPQKIYDLSEEQDEMFFDFQAIFAKMEYKMIKKRMKRGKVAGAKKGMWTNGTPPYPYIYNQKEKCLEVDEGKYKIYRLIVDKYLGGMSLQEIAVWLNQHRIPTAYGAKRNKNGWSAKVIQDLLVNEIHLGYVIYGKTRTVKGNVEAVSREDWIKVKGNHTPVKADEEHEQILAKLKHNVLLPKRCRSSIVYPLSGLIYCSKCGRRMQLKRKHVNGENELRIMCVHTYPDGSKCDQVGMKVDESVYQLIYDRIIKIDAISMNSVKDSQDHRRELQFLLLAKEQELLKTEEAIGRLFELYEENGITKQRFTERMAIHEQAREQLTEERDNYRDAIKAISNPLTVEKMRQRVEDFKLMWVESTTPEEKNKAFRTLVEKIFYNRVEDGVTLEVLYK